MPEILSENFSGSLAKKFTGSDNLLKEIAIKVTGEFASGDNLLEEIAIKATRKLATGNFSTIESSFKPIVFPAYMLVHMCGFLREFLCEIFRVLFLIHLFFSIFDWLKEFLILLCCILLQFSLFIKYVPQICSQRKYKSKPQICSHLQCPNNVNTLHHFHDSLEKEKEKNNING